MAKYQITLTDGSVLVVEANSPEEATQIASRQIDEQYAAQQSTPASQAPAQRTMTEAETAQDIAAGASRGMAPYVAAATLGAGAGVLFGGVGAGPGAAAGVAAVGAAQFIGDPLVDSVNSLFGTKFTKPTEALNQLMDMAGMAKPESQAGQMAEKVAAGVSGGVAGVGAARSVAAGAAPGSLTQGVAQTMAAAPVSQIVAGGTGAGGAELARQSGAGPIGQTVAGLAGGLGGGLVTNMAGSFGSRIGMQVPPRSDMPMLEQGFDNTTNMTVRVPMQQQRAPLPMTYEDVARDARTAATGGMGSQQAVERLARAAPLNRDAAAAAERLGIDVPPDVLMDHTELRQAVGLTRSMPGTVASAAWVDAVERAATQADEAMATINGSRDLSEVSDTVRTSMNDTKAALEAQAGDMYDLINAKIRGGAPGAAAPDVGAYVAKAKEQGFNTDKVYYHGAAKQFEQFDMSKVGQREIPWYGKGAYLSPDKDVARRYATSDQNVMPFFVRGKLLKVDKDSPLPEWLEKSRDFAATLTERGYSGLEIGGKIPEVVVFNPADLIRATPPKAVSPDAVRYTAKPASWDKTGKSWVIMDAETGTDTGGVMSKAEAEDTVRSLQKKQPAAAAIAPTSQPRTETRSTVDLINSRRLMNEVLYGEDGKGGLGGNTDSLTTLEKKVLELSATGRENPVMYDELVRLRQDIGAARRKANSPYGDVNTGILDRLYSVLAKDQLLAVERLGGKQMADDFRLANQIYAKQKALGDTIVSLFGDPRTGSIAPKLLTAIKSGSKGDIAGFNRIIDELPADLRKKAVASTIAAIAKEDKTNAFGFAKYVSLYQGLRDNSLVYKKVVETVGPDSEKFLNDLFKISKRITEARAQVLTTGKANQALVQGLMAEGLVEGVMRSTLGRQTVMGAATAIGGVAAGPAAGAASAMLANSLSQARKSTLNAAGDLFASPEWQQLVINVSTKQNVNQKIYNAARNSGAFKKWAREAGITDPDQWLRSTISSTIGMGAAEKTQPFQAGMGRPE